jgi:hypothetical protein
MVGDLMDIAYIGSLFLEGDDLEDVMVPHRRVYTNGDDIDFDEERFNRLKITLLRIERIAPIFNVLTALWVKRPDNDQLCEILVAGRGLPPEGANIIKVWEEIDRAFSGIPTRKLRLSNETIYYPIRNSDNELVGVLEVSAASETYFV